MHPESLHPTAPSKWRRRHRADGNRPRHRPAWLGATVLVAAGTAAVLAGCEPADPSCWDSTVPAGALADQPPPVFCSIDAAGPTTAQPGPNTWVDDFDHGLSLADFADTGYTSFDTVGGVAQSTHWRHADHWMVDIAPDPANDPAAEGASGGAMIRPNQTFRFDQGKLVVETTFAAGMLDYEVPGGQAWGEIDLTTAAAPTTFRRNGLYGYDLFPGHYTLGCRLQPDSHTICSLMDNSQGTQDGGGRVWEMSFFQQVGATNFGGADFVGDGEVFANCAPGDSDASCRSQFRLELTRTSLAIYIDDTLYFEQTGIPPLPDELVNGDLHVYASSMLGRHSADVVRYHWDRIAVNP